MTLTDDIIEILNANGIDTTKYDETRINALYNEALKLIDAPFTKTTTHTDYINIFHDNKYITNFYPVLLDDDITIKLNDNIVEPVKVTKEGIIYFKNNMHGVLEVTYNVGIDDDDINNYIIPLIVAMIKNNENRNGISSISEGDISISYNATTGTVATSIDDIIKNIRNKYAGRLRLI